MISHVLLIHSVITGCWTVRLMYLSDKKNMSYLCFDCEFEDEKTARKTAMDIAQNLSVRWEESE